MSVLRAWNEIWQDLRPLFLAGRGEQAGDAGEAAPAPPVQADLPEEADAPVEAAGLPGPAPADAVPEAGAPPVAGAPAGKGVPAAAPARRPLAVGRRRTPLNVSSWDGTRGPRFTRRREF